MADELIMVTSVMVKPPTIPGSASGNSTCQMMCQRRQPMACAASIRPWSTSRKLTSAIRAKNGASDWALLLGADAVRARVRIGTTTFDVDRVALQQAWTGEYAALWRGPETLAEPTTPDGRGPAVDWVHAHLSPAYTGPAVLDAAMREAVRTFQQSRGLATDGVIGPETLLALGAQDPGPRLKTQLH